MMVKRNRETIEQKIIAGFFRGLWWLIKSPFYRAGEKKSFSLNDQKYLISRRQQIDQMLVSENLSDLRQAVMEADKLIDWILKKRNYKGQTFADRLRSAEKDIPKDIYNNIWQGHKIRNQVAHEDSDISSETLRFAVKKILTYNG